MGHGKFKVVHKKHSKRNVSLEARADDDVCKRGGIIKPAAGEVVDSMQPIEIEWEPSCLGDSKEVNIILYAPSTDLGAVQVFQGVASSRKTLTAKLEPYWWKSTPTVQLQFRLVPPGVMAALAELPPGPIFQATYSPPADGTTPEEANNDRINLGITNASDLEKKGMTGGQTAAAVLVPLIVIALAVGAFFKWKRSKGMEKRKKWTETVDKRMSTISTDWKSVTNAGAQAAIRNSMAANRASTFSFGGGVRPSSQFERDFDYDEKSGDMSQRRPGVGLRNPSGLSNGAERVSRVSFAADPRPSGESRRTKAFRDSYVPPVPSIPNIAAKSDEDGSSEGSGAMSPTQTEGALTLTPEAIRARIAAGRARSASKSSGEKDVTEGGMEGYDEVMPALALMRTGHANTNSTDDLLFQPPAAPAAAYPKAVGATPSPLATNIATGYTSPTVSSPVMASIPMPAMQAMPASVMSPDDMLRAYAERKKMSVSYPSPTPTSGISYPSPVATTGSRTLFTGTVTPQGTGDKKERPPSLGFAPGEYDPDFKFSGNDDPYGGYEGYEAQPDAASGAAGAGMAGRGAFKG